MIGEPTQRCRNLGGLPVFAPPQLCQRAHAVHLTLQLRALEADGLVHRTVYAEVPPRAEYRQTAPAKDMTDVYMALKRWSLAHRELLKLRAAKAGR